MTEATRARHKRRWLPVIGFVAVFVAGVVVGLAIASGRRAEGDRQATKDTAITTCGPRGADGITRVGGTTYNNSSRPRDFTVRVAVISPGNVQLGVGTAQALGLDAHQHGQWLALTDVAPEHWTAGSTCKVLSVTRS